ncbi:hypothetical protein SAMN04488691_10899 [Haloferax larsenii]|uniref:ISH3 family transposase n=1 Tax=Haloferax larsenii TaxID=302484 RepID=A0A1H7T6V8_HALLR|nr:hypothetical protein SAMN04488691_10899 [Haloferax larsenii]
MPKQQQQADSEIHEDQLLNFLVNSLDEEVSLNLGDNAEINGEDIYEVLVGACTDGTSVSTLCENSEDAPPANTVLYHLRTKFELDQLEQVGNTLLQKDVLDVLPQQVEVCADLHLRPYYGDEDDTDGLYHSQAKRGTTAFHAYATLYARVKNKRYTLAVRRLEDGATTSSVLADNAASGAQPRVRHADRPLGTDGQAGTLGRLESRDSAQSDGETRRSQLNRRVSRLYRLYLPERTVRRPWCGASRLST